MFLSDNNVYKKITGKSTGDITLTGKRMYHSLAADLTILAYKKNIAFIAAEHSVSGRLPSSGKAG